MVIYLSCKYYKTIYNAPLDVKASQDVVSNGTNENPLSASPLCSLSNHEGISVAKSGVFLSQLQSHLFEIVNSTRLQVDVP